MTKKKFISGIMALALIGTSMATIPANAEIQDTYTATMMGSVGTFGVWDDSCSTEITGDGQYVLEWTLDSATQASTGGGAIFIDTSINPYDFLPEGYTPVNEDGTTAQKAEIAKATGITLSVDSVEVDGVEITYNGPSEGAYVCESDDSGNRLRLNVYNVWGNEVSDIDFNFAVESSIKVTFSIAGLDEARENAEYTAGATTTSQNTEYTTTTNAPSSDIGGVDDTTVSSAPVTTTPAPTTSTYVITATDYAKAYEPILAEVASTYGANKYYIYDIDNDGIFELLVQTGTSESDYAYDIYTLKNGKASKIDTIAGEHTVLCIPENESVGFYAHRAQMGYETVTYYTYENGKLNSTVIIDRTSDEYMEYEKIENTDVNDYSLINNIPDRTFTVEITTTTTTTTTTTSSSKKNTVGSSSSSSSSSSTSTSSSANTGDSGVASVLVALGLATLTATALRKKD